MNAKQSFTATQIFLHWAIAALVIFEIVGHELVENAWRAQRASQFSLGPLDLAFWDNPHIIAGSLIFLLMLWRIALRMRDGAPPPPASEPTIFQFASKWVQIAFYFLLVLMPISGFVQYLGGPRMAHEIHEIGEPIILALVAVHIGAALVHHFWWKTNVLKRIIGRA